MIKNISNMGSVLDVSEQKSINGGSGICPSQGVACDENYPPLINCITDVPYCCVDGYFEECY
ncbi:hypothetical protein [Tenacibaculum singaporense]|uniref:Uncharacterized protein n=1 Tax=Tenacibaculum singaporense TaxID=2358479 RepID=A0A3Q8RP93_9FLAO|nr:hypothetical protein [Tenacibaculum singaporense]AZJ36085.1 hypothetical protein D6T69_11320 [Tenacibaculum singaporense]